MTRPPRGAAPLLLAAFLLLPADAPAQDAPDSTRSGNLHVFVDCNTFCDFDHFRREIAYVNYVRDRQVAQVHVLITGRETGGGGTEFTLRFIGLREFAGLDDELRYASSQTDTEDEVRNGLTQTLRLGLVRYVARLPMGKDLKISFEGSEAGQESRGPDPWNFWVFEASINGFFEGQSSTRSRFLDGSLSASRTTEEWKHNFFVSGHGSRETFEFSDSTEADGTGTLVSRSSSYHAEGLVVRSLSPHWSAGFNAAVRSSTFENLDLQYRIAPAIEYDIYPYGESTRRQFTFLYQVGYIYADYEERTIFGKDREGRFAQSLIVSADVTQPWGNAHATVEAFNYLSDFSKNSIEVFAGLEFRVFRGLNLNLFAGYERVRDQLNLPATGATPEEVLLELKELQTSYQYEISVGLSYTFGSIYNNVVNPRFEALD
jgi:hypothetical protein